MKWYGRTLKGLRNAASGDLQRRAWEAQRHSSETQPPEFRSFQSLGPQSPASTTHASRIYVSLNEDTVQDNVIQELLRIAWYEVPSNVSREPGWYVLEVEPGGPKSRYGRRQPKYLGELRQALEDFVATALIPEKGPAYEDAFAGSQPLPLHEIKTLKKVEDERLANDAIRRGWYLLGLDATGEQGPQYELISRQTIYVLGHPEEDAV